MRKYYNERYFAWQKKAGVYGASQDLWMYEAYIKGTDTVLDFGCGGGYLLEKLRCKVKYGIDINPVARKEATEKGIIVFKTIEDIPSGLKFGVILSHHTLEHVEDPAKVLKAFKKYLTRKGLLICVVPIDDWRRQKKYTEKDSNKHLYTWTPLLLGNLFVHCGYTIKQIDIITQAWLPLSRFYYNYIPSFLYKILSYMWSMIFYARQIRIIAIN